MSVDTQDSSGPTTRAQANGDAHVLVQHPPTPSDSLYPSVPPSPAPPKPPYVPPFKILMRPESTPPAPQLTTPFVLSTLSPDTPRSNEPSESTAPAPRDKQVTLLRRASSHRRSSSAGQGGTGGTGEVRTPRASSEGRGGRPLSSASDTEFRRTESEPVLSSPSALDGTSTGLTTPSRSPSPELQGETLADEATGEVGDEGESVAPLDAALMAALALPRDRFLLLRAETELERFIMDPTMSRLPLSPPYFPPALNSYQRLLIHRLADTFGITREVEPMSPSVWAATASSSNIMNVPTGIVVLVKGESTKLPLVKLATHVPAPPPTPLPTIASTATSSASPSHSIPPSPVSSSSYLPLPVAQAQPQFFKILPRTSHRPTSSASSSVGADEDGKGKGRKEKTLEERETAYKEARERIFKAEAEEKGEVDEPAKIAAMGGGIARPSSAGSAYSRSSAMSLAGTRPSPSVVSESSSVYSSVHSGFQGSAGTTVYYSQPSPQMRMLQGAQGGNPSLRPSAPIFDPSIGAWTPPGAYFGYSDDGQHHQQQLQATPEHYSRPYEGDWARQQMMMQQQQQQQQQRGGPSSSHQQRQPALQQPWQHPSARPLPQAYPQPPIQVTAPSPLPQHATWASPLAPPLQPPIVPSPSYAIQYPPFASSSPYVQPSEPFHPPPAVWTRQPPLPSPALSTTSSGGSSYPTANPPSLPSAVDRAGYVMRFAEGGVVGVSGFSTRSASSLSSVSSSSTSRTASSIARSGLGMGEQRSVRKVGHSKSPSFGSGVSGSTNEDRERVGGSLSGGSGSPSGSAGREGGKEGGEGKSRSPVAPLHPSLPAKPSWVTKPAPVERSTSASSQAAASTTSPSDTGARRTFPLTSSVPLSHPHNPPVQSPYPHYPTQSPHDPNAGYYDRRPPPPSSYPSYSSPGLPSPSYYTSQPPTPQSGAGQWWDPSHPHSPVPPPGSSYYPYESYSREPDPSPHAYYEGGAGERGGRGEQELRRPPPRSTELYDPNRTGGDEGEKKGRSRVDAVVRGTEGLRL